MTPDMGGDAAGGDGRAPKSPGGLVHSYQRYDPTKFPSPTAPPPDVSGAAFEHMLMYGDMSEFTEEQLANAIKIDPSMFPQLGPSLAAIRAMLEERKRKILEKYETSAAQREAAEAYGDQLKGTKPPRGLEGDFEKATRREHIRDLERLWYKQEEQSAFAKDLLRLIDRLSDKYQVEELASKYNFTGREEMTVPEALEIKEELEKLDELLQQLKDAEKNAQLGIIDMEELSQYADPGDIEGLNRLQEEIQDYIKEQAEQQGLAKTRDGFKLGPKAFKLFQRRLLQEIFADLEAARSGRHQGPIIGEGAVEIERTKPYEFGDSAGQMDVPRTIVNAAVRSAQRSGDGGDRVRVSMDDIDIHQTKNNPKCATSVLMDMSGSMRFDGQYINCKRMALALDGLIRSEYPGDFISFFEVYSLAKRRDVSDIPTLLPKPVSIRSPVVRLKADLSDTDISEVMLPQHFTNIQHGLRLARQVLAVQDTPNRQIMLITDGLPTAHFEGSELLLLYPPDPRTEQATMREAQLCAREGITINIFLLPNWGQTSEDVQFAHRVAEQTKGRVFFTGGRDLDRFVLWDYVRNRRAIIG